MSVGDLLNVQPSDLKFPVEARKQTSCSMQLTNKSDGYVAFKVKTTNPKKYSVRPNTGIILPRTSCTVTVTMQAPKESPPDMQCKDKFLIQSVVAPDGAATKDITGDMFNKEEGKVLEEFKMRVVYVPAKSPSPIPEESEEGSPPRNSLAENDARSASLLEAVSRSLEEPKDNSSEAHYIISKLTEEKTSALQQTQKLQQELEFVRKQVSRNRGSSFSLLFVLLVGLLGILVGYFIKRT